jgi:hypothetical protein
MDNEFPAVTVLIRGMSVKEVLEKLGGIGRDKPVRAVSMADVFAERDEYKKYADFFVDSACQSCRGNWDEWMIELEEQGDL